jgi:hypothetical protein
VTILLLERRQAGTLHDLHPGDIRYTSRNLLKTVGVALGANSLAEKRGMAGYMPGRSFCALQDSDDLMVMVFRNITATTR